MRRSLSTSLLITTSLILVVGTLTVFGLGTSIARFQPNWVRDRDLRSTVEHVIDGLQLDSRGAPTAVSLARSLQQVLDALPADVFYQVLDEKGDVLISSNGATQSVVPQGLAAEGQRKIFKIVRADLPLRVIVEPVPGSKPRLYAMVARSDRFDATLLDNEYGNFTQAILIAVIATMAVFSLVILVTFRRVLRPLTDASAAAAQIDPTNLRSRLKVDDVPVEIVPLIQSFNAALERLETGFRIQQDFLATAAHELKTPLALIRGEMELDGPLNRRVILADLDHMSRHVHQLLHLAEVSDANNLTICEFDAAPIIHDAINSIERLAAAKNVVVDMKSADQPVTLQADASALYVLARNLIENAVNHAPTDSFVSVVLNDREFSVSDMGTGIPDKDIPMLFKRFWRDAHRRDEGAGLGLSICSEISRGHGWAISASNVVPVGARFKVEFGAGKL